MSATVRPAGHVTGSLTVKEASVQRVDSGHGSRDGGTLDVDVSLEASRGPRSANHSRAGTTRQHLSTAAHLRRVLVHVDVHHPSVLVTLFNDIVLDVQLPTSRPLTATNTHLHVVFGGSETGVCVRVCVYLLGLNMLDSWKQCVARG